MEVVDIIKPENQVFCKTKLLTDTTMSYCPGCGHGTAHRVLAEVINEMGIQEEEFYEAISSFTGAGKRLELIGSKGKSRIFKDFAHAPSKVSATVNAVKEQFKDHKVAAVLELHTFSSLTPEFIVGYKGAMDAADEAIVYFNPEAVAHKKLPPLSEEIVKEAFANKNILVTTDADLIFDNQQKNFGEKDVLLIMTSGNFHGKNLEKVAQEILR